ncbi:MAG: hypothetical protein PHW29_04360 [Flavobacterium sp.]|nr:hypothetical protein [Flavobacterium sp.]
MEKENIVKTVYQKVWVDTGKDTIKKIMGINAIKGGGTLVVNVIKSMILGTKSDTVETFDVARTRLGIDNEHIKLVYKRYTQKFYVSLFSAIFLIGLIIYYGYIQHSFGGLLSSTAVFTISLANMFNTSFRTFQIRKRTLYPVSEWFKRKEEWIPKF